jgi:hypothetical protein
MEDNQLGDNLFHSEIGHTLTPKEDRNKTITLQLMGVSLLQKDIGLPIQNRWKG